LEDVEYEIELLRKLLSNLVPLVEETRVAATDVVVELVLEEGVVVEEVAVEEVTVVDDASTVIDATEVVGRSS
jgi:hypothetical protein